jgi:hypothetical protein
MLSGGRTTTLPADEQLTITLLDAHHQVVAHRPTRKTRHQRRPRNLCSVAHDAPHAVCAALPMNYSNSILCWAVVDVGSLFGQTELETEEPDS